jgi:hypothetical protein
MIYTTLQNHLTTLLILASYVMTAANAHTALLFGANGAVGLEVLRSIVDNNSLWEELILVGRRFPSKVTDLLPDLSSAGEEQQQQLLPKVTQIQLSDLSNVDENEELLQMKADACFIAVGSGSPQDMNLRDWHSVEVDLIASITKLCDKIQVKTVALLSAVDTEDEPIPFTQDKLNTADANPLGWMKMVSKYTRMMGLKELAVINESKNVPFVRIFRPSNIITKEIRYGWLDWTLFKFHKVFDPIIPIKYHSVKVGLLGEAMVNDAAQMLSSKREGDVVSSRVTKHTYGDFLNIMAKKSEECGGGGGGDTQNEKKGEL